MTELEQKLEKTKYLLQQKEARIEDVRDKYYKVFEQLDELENEKDELCDLEYELEKGVEEQKKQIEIFKRNTNV